MTPEADELIHIFAGLAIALGLIWFSLRVDGWRIRRMIREEVKREITVLLDKPKKGKEEIVCRMQP